MEGCLLIGGRAPAIDLLGDRLKDCEIVMAADSGLAHAAGFDLQPTDIVGDLDSVDEDVLAGYPGIRRHLHPQDKDYTDTELGIALLREMGAVRIHLVGGGGGRLDHLYAILSLFYRDDAPDHWYTQHEHIVHINNEMRMNLPKGKRVSFFPAGTDVCRMQSRGLKWPLDGLAWTPGDFGISNLTTDTDIEVKMLNGRLIMMYDLSAKDRA